MSAKQYVLASRAAMEAILRPFNLGGTQWWVLAQLASQDHLRQRDLAVALHVERATASELVLTLVRKGVVEQRLDPTDQRQKMLRLTDAGRRLWQSMPDPLELLYEISFHGMTPEALAGVSSVLHAATQRLAAVRSEGGETS